jgi:hypothetical protein
MNDENEPSGASGGYRIFLGLPVTLYGTEWNGEWSRRVTRFGTVKDLLDTWDIDDPDEQSEIAQVLRHLRDATIALHPPMKASDAIKAIRKAKKNTRRKQR